MNPEIVGRQQGTECNAGLFDVLAGAFQAVDDGDDAIDHGAGVVSRYAHLGSVAGGLELGDAVTAGQLIGFVGESGTPESIFAPGTDEHVHFEIRIDESFLGAGLGPLEARSLYLEAFGIVEDTP